MSKKQQAKQIRPTLHVGYLIQYIITEKPNYTKWWVVWYNHETMEGIGMGSFSSFVEASEWDERNPPCALREGNFTRATIVYAGESYV